MIRDRHEHQVAGDQRPLREDLEVALRVEDDDSGLVGVREDPSHEVRIADLLLELRDAPAGGHVVDAVLAETDRPIQRAVPQRYGERFGGELPFHVEHAVDQRLIVEADDENGQVLVQRAQIDGQVGGDRRLPDAALVVDHGDDTSRGPAGGRLERISPTRLRLLQHVVDSTHLITLDGT